MMHQFMKFGIIGILNTLIDFGLFNLLVLVSGIKSGPGIGVINLVAVGVAAAHSYCLNRYWTFGAGAGNHRLQLKRFVLVTATGMMLNSLIVTAAAGLADSLPLAAIVVLNGGKVLAAVVSATWNFLCYRGWVFIPPPVKAPGSDYVPELVSIIIPAYNERHRLPPRLRTLAAQLSGRFPVEIIVVDDGSTDETLALAHEISTSYPFIRCTGYAVNRGKGQAVKTGMLAARGQYLLFTDADETFTVNHIEHMAERLRAGEQVVIASRTQAGSERLQGESYCRRILGWGFNLLVQTFFLPGIVDSQCGLKGFAREAARDIFSRQRICGFAFDVEILLLAQNLGYKIQTLPVQAIDSPGSRVNRLLAPIQMFGDLLKLIVFRGLNLYNLPQAPAARLALGLGLFVVALGVRIPWLWEVPRYIDELKEVNLAYMIYQGQTWPLHNVAHDIGALHNYILAGLFKFLGPNIYLPRLYVAVTAALTVVLFYHLGKKLYGHGVGLIAAALLLSNGMHILVTHMAWSNCTTPFFFTLALLAAVNAQMRKSGSWLVLSALLWALALQTHASVIVYVAVFALYILSPGFRKIGLATRWYIYALLVFLAGYSNMIYFNIVSGGGSLTWLVHKDYALESNPGIMSYLHNLEGMFIELIRASGSIYNSSDGLGGYLSSPLFLITILLLLIGSYYALSKGRSLPLWMLAGGFASIPWINQRYVFFIATRYIMPLIICALLLIACGLSVLAGRASKLINRPGMRLRAIPVAALLLLMVLQVIPFYTYCAGIADTNQSNRMTLKAATLATQAAAKEKAIIILEKDLPLENNPLPVIFNIMKQPYSIMEKEVSVGAFPGDVGDILSRQEGSPLVMVLSEKAYLVLKPELAGSKTTCLSGQVLFPPEAKEIRNIYIVEMKGAKPKKDKDNPLAEPALPVIQTTDGDR